MAHSFQFAQNANTERTIGATDSIQYVYMWFFNQAARATEPDAAAVALCRHYSSEVANRRTSCLDLRLGEVMQSASLRTWYLRNLAQMAVDFDDSGEAVDNDYLNAISELRTHYARPIPTNKLKNLLNDIQWILAVPGSQPSDDFVWFEDALPQP
ncbi:hypothetical protein [Hymenobacter edaphi]|uniref:Uncharacterized protein n=1 Tax=Hymenobacter edaphi TaxID=2211146 RepID=A0A328BET0_9BACT|nr:hypothetical protein [Hymenobacter edaphi]RAK65239.1 hypothetical protein DLM85_17035 [Hymenobacter edaphi]